MATSGWMSRNADRMSAYNPRTRFANLLLGLPTQSAFRVGCGNPRHRVWGVPTRVLFGVCHANIMLWATSICFEVFTGCANDHFGHLGFRVCQPTSPTKAWSPPSQHVFGICQPHIVFCGVGFANQRPTWLFRVWGLLPKQHPVSVFGVCQSPDRLWGLPTRFGICQPTSGWGPYHSPFRARVHQPTSPFRLWECPISK